MPVPNNTSFSLAEVCDEIGLTSSDRNLFDCFQFANPSGFDPLYTGAKNSLLNFRNYSHSIPTSSLSLADEKSASNACTRYATPASRDIRYIPNGQSFSNATQLFTNSTGTTNAPSNWYSNGSIARYWNGSSFTATENCSGAGSTTLDVSPSVINDSDGFGGSFTITVTSNTTWNVTDNRSWISFSGNSNSNNDTFNVILSLNDTGSTRSGTVTVFTTSGSSISRTIFITQPDSGVVA